MDRPTFLRDLRRANLPSAPAIEAAFARLPEGDGARALARSLVAQGLLSRLQARQLLAGKASRLTLGPYCLVEPLGRGGAGRVYKAVHTPTARAIAIKVVLPRGLKESILPRGLKGRGGLNAFRREVRAATQLQHPNIVTTYDSGRAKGVYFLVMEYIAGPTLQDLVKEQGPLPVSLACELMRQAAEALQHAHEKGVVHRDIKPTNLLIVPSGATLTEGWADDPAKRSGAAGAALLKVVDFDLARLRHGAGSGVVDTIRAGTGTVLGTLDYISPEQANNIHDTDIRSDLYSLGCTFYYALTLSVPFPANTPAARLVKHIMEEPPPLEAVRPDAPAGVAAIYRRLLAKDRGKRFQTPAELAQELAPWCGTGGGHLPPAVVESEPSREAPAGKIEWDNRALPGRPPRAESARFAPGATPEPRGPCVDVLPMIPPFPPGAGPARMVPFDGWVAPQAPVSLPDTGLDESVLAGLALKLAFTAAHFTDEWMAGRLRLPLPLVRETLGGLRADGLVDVLGPSGPLTLRYAIGPRGRERAARLLEISGYVGPAPVSLDAYAAVLEAQVARAPPVRPGRVAAALSDLVIPDEAVHLAGLAAASGRSLFVFGPAGNGKTTLGRLLHDAVQGDVWVPYGIAVEGNIVRVFDPLHHQAVAAEHRGIDRRWVRVRRPLVVLGTEITLDTFELTYSPTLRFYEAPLHVKANGGTLLIDDLGRERVDTHQLLNRCVLPLERGADYLTLSTGQRVQVPVRQLLILATNLDPEAVMDPAFLRRLGYRLYLGGPTPEQYGRIFARYAARRGLDVAPGLVLRVVDRYRAEGRVLRGCEPRDLVERVWDICSYEERPPELSEELLDRAWRGYFGPGRVGT